jgi:hypothetical protein
MNWTKIAALTLNYEGDAWGLFLEGKDVGGVVPVENVDYDLIPKAFSGEGKVETEYEGDSWSVKLDGKEIATVIPNEDADYDKISAALAELESN